MEGGGLPMSNSDVHVLWVSKVYLGVKPGADKALTG